jgi:hypothetical protein
MVNLPYQPPVSHLLTYPAVNSFQVKDWPNYVADLGLTAEHIPALIDMMLDETFLKFWDDAIEAEELPDLGPDVSAPDCIIIHAWRALGQLRAEAAIPACLQILTDYEDIEWAWEEIPAVLSLIGPVAIAPVHAALLNPEVGEGPKFILSGALTRLASTYPEHRDSVVKRLADFLADPQNDTPDLNGNICGNLVELKAVEVADVLEAAFAENRISLRMAGTWAQVQVDLGLKSAEDFAPEDFEVPRDENFETMMANVRQYLDQLKAMEKPSANELGLPLDYSQVNLGFQPPTFDRLARRPQDQPGAMGQGFSAGPAKEKKKKGKKKKKK